MSNAVPDGWSLSTINDTCEVLDSKRIPLNSQERAQRQGLYPYFGANGVQGYIDDFIFEGEHVLLAEDGGYFDEWDSRPISYLVSERFWVNNHAHILKAKQEHETKYVHYSLVHKDIQKHINGGTRSKLNQSDMREIEYLTPPLPEQQKIATILSSVDNVIETTRAQIDKLKDLKTGMMQELLTKGIGVDGVPHTEFKESPVGRIPVGWNVVELSTITKVIDCKHATPKYFREGYPVVKPGDIKEGNLDVSGCSLTDKEGFDNLNEKHKPRTGDTIYSRNQTYGIGAFVHKDIDFAIGQDVCVIHPKSGEPKYIFFALNAPVVRDQVELLSAGSTFKRINLGSIRKLLIPVPPKSEQIAITSTLSSIDAKIRILFERLNAFQHTKKALMQDLLTGKVRVKIKEKEKESAVA